MTIEVCHEPVSFFCSDDSDTKIGLTPRKDTFMTLGRFRRQTRNLADNTPLRVRVGNAITGTTSPASANIVRDNGQKGVVVTRQRGRPSNTPGLGNGD